MSPILTTLILSAVSVVLMALSRFVRPMGRVCGVLSILWLADPKSSFITGQIIGVNGGFGE